MSDETKHVLKEAADAVDAARDEADALMQECLDRVAAGIPAAVDRVAKQTAQSQPEVTKDLGADGIKALREELAARAAELAEYVRTGRERIKWPMRDSEWSEVGSRHIHSALFEDMFGAQVNRVGNVFGSHGYDLRNTARGSQQGLLLPQHLYDQDSFGAVADAINKLGSAVGAFKKAKAADDRDTVDSLWDEA